MIDVNAIEPLRKASTATSFDALKIAGNPPPSSPHRFANSIAGNLS
jgi:hypothetical protein